MYSTFVQLTGMRRFAKLEGVSRAHYARVYTK